MAAKMEEIKKEVMAYVNSKVGKSSKINTIEEREEEFEKTPALKIKRYLYSNKSKDNGGTADGKQKSWRKSRKPKTEA